jgi:Ser/Thr protein kinase RdoA (MazF antagonist)
LDFELDNIIWEGEQPGIIDFDDCAWYWLVADIALALSDLFGESANRVDLQHESLLHFVEGYRTMRQIDQEELKLIPLFLRLDSLIDFAKLHRTMTPIDPAGELPWMAGLRDKLSAKMQFYRDELA